METKARILIDRKLPKEHNWYHIHINFHAAPELVHKISRVPGVALIREDSLSQYKMEMSIGRMFDTEEVEGKVRKAIRNYAEQNHLFDD